MIAGVALDYIASEVLTLWSSKKGRKGQQRDFYNKNKNQPLAGLFKEAIHQLKITLL